MDARVTPSAQRDEIFQNVVGLGSVDMVDHQITYAVIGGCAADSTQVAIAVQCHESLLTESNQILVHPVVIHAAKSLASVRFAYSIRIFLTVATAAFSRAARMGASASRLVSPLLLSLVIFGARIRTKSAITLDDNDFPAPLAGLLGHDSIIPSLKLGMVLS
jgi:hypothetical protein